jgi:predicted lipoprotein with Yx(FWY)xxD motif
MHMLGHAIKAIALSVWGLVMLAASVGADSHGNKYVHSRAFNGQVYIMYRDHMSLYTYDKDQTGVSNCNDECAVIWPPALLASGTELGENYTLIMRKDGTMQAAFRGKPLYLYSQDQNPGDTMGDGEGGVWHLARP